MSEKHPHAATALFGGSCACGRIFFESSVLPERVHNCHCVTCRKISGGPYQSFADVGSKDVLFYDKQDSLRYDGLPVDNIGGIAFKRFSKSGERAFCRDCNSMFAMRYKHYPWLTGLTLGSLDEQTFENDAVAETLKPRMQIFSSQRIWWYDVGKDGLPCFERFSDDFEIKMKEWEQTQTA